MGISKITIKQKQRFEEILNYIVEYRENNYGETPSQQQIADALFYSKESVRRWCVKMRYMGIIDYGWNFSKTLVILEV